MAKAHSLANNAPLFSHLKVLDIYSINSFSVVTCMYSYHHNRLPSVFRHLFLSNNQVHHYETRLASHYRPHFVELILIKKPKNGPLSTFSPDFT